MSFRFGPLPDPGPSPREIARDVFVKHQAEMRAERARVAERRRPIREFVYVLRRQTGDPNLLGGVRA